MEVVNGKPDPDSNLPGSFHRATLEEEEESTGIKSINQQEMRLRNNININ